MSAPAEKSERESELRAEAETTGRPSSQPREPSADGVPDLALANDAAMPEVEASEAEPARLASSGEEVTTAGEDAPPSGLEPPPEAPSDVEPRAFPAAPITLVRASSNVAPRRTPRHWPLLVLVLILLVGSFMLVFASALPAVARELGWTHAHTVSRASRHSTNASRAGVDAVREREQKLALEGQDEEDDEPLGATQVGISAQATTLFRGPSVTTSPVGAVERGERLVVVREEHGFLLVIHHGREGTDIGWVRKADVLVR